MTTRPVLIPALKKAVDIAGGQRALAKQIGVSQQLVWGWLYYFKARRVPAEYVLPIEHATHGCVTRHELRPDIYPQDQQAA